MSFDISLTGLAAAIDILRSLSIEFDDGAIYVVGPTVHYAVYHELGTVHMDARPFARPAAERVQANLESKVGEFLEGDLLGADEEAIAKATALAVEAEMKRIITQKGIVDTGAMRASVSIERVS